MKVDVGSIQEVIRVIFPQFPGSFWKSISFVALTDPVGRKVSPGSRERKYLYLHR